MEINQQTRREYGSNSCWNPIFKESDEYCPTHGCRLQEIDTGHSFDPQTGERIEHFIKACVKPVTRRFLWWTWVVNEGCGTRGCSD